MATKTYGIAAGEDYIKIGRSSCPSERCKDIQVHCPVELRLVFVIEGDHESRLHEKFKEDRLHAEWFRYSQQIKTFVSYNSYHHRHQTGSPTTLPHGNKGVPLSPEHRAAISRAWEEKRKNKSISIDDLPKMSPLYKKLLG